MSDVFGIISDSRSLGGLVEAQNNTILILDTGSVVLEINFKRHTIYPKQVVFLFSDEIVSFIEASDRLSIRYLTLPLEMIENAVYSISSPYFWHTLYDIPAFSPASEFMSFLNYWYNESCWLISNLSGEVGCRSVDNQMFNLLAALEKELINSDLSNRTQPLSSGWTHLFNFLRLVDKHCDTHHDVKFYAEKLNITTTYLNKVANKLWCVSPKEILNRQIMLRIKNMLLNSTMTVSEIAVIMCFEDSSYLARYFKKMSGLSPTEFRIKHTEDL